jgi:undecaprenyl diphosphate synthase
MLAAKVHKRDTASAEERPAVPPQHVAIIMDGNGRWATRAGLSRLEGHRAGVEAARRAVRAARDEGVKIVTLYSFSTENWSRPDWEVRHLLGLLRRFFAEDLQELASEGVKVRILGDHGSLPPDLKKLVIDAESMTRHNSDFLLQVAFNYGGRDEIVRAVSKVAERVARGELRAEDIRQEHLSDELDTAGVPDPDMVIRTSGECRISNFLLWQAAYSELVFLDCFWPDFGRKELRAAIEDFHRRDRRYGGRNGEVNAAQ